MSDLEKKFKKARKAWRADKEDAKLKKAWKAAKLAWEKEQEGGATPNKKRKADDAEDTPKKKGKKGSKKKAEKAEKAETDEADVAALEKALKKARKAKKAEASPANKKAFKAAKKALEDAKKDDAEEKEEPEKEAEPEKPAEEAGGLAGLKKGGNSWDAPAESESEPSEKLFCGNMSFDVEDDGVREFFKDCGTLTDIFWLTHKDTGNFKGCGFITFDSLDAAKKAFTEKNGAEFMGREIKLDYAKARTGGKGGKGGKGREPKVLGEKPDGCTTVFCGNLSYDIDEAAMQEFATSAGCGEIKAIRWLTDRESGDFKGVGFVDFWDTGDVDKLVLKNGEDVKGRGIRLDYSAPREKKEW